MEVTLLAVGKADTEWVREGVSLYSGRIAHYFPFEVVEIVPPKAKSRGAAARQPLLAKEAEGEALLSRLRPSDCLALWDGRGRMLSSEAFSQWMQRRLMGGFGRLVFAIGGAYGFSQAVYDRADVLLSLSPMTFPHQLVRIVVAEQIYRACTLLKREPYHHGNENPSSGATCP